VYRILSVTQAGDVASVILEIFGDVATPDLVARGFDADCAPTTAGEQLEDALPLSPSLWDA
jgi:hypothetical protein